jgi:hypothetical protein
VKGVARELAKHNSELVELQDVRQVKGGTEPADDYIFVYGAKRKYGER